VNNGAALTGRRERSDMSSDPQRPVVTLTYAVPGATGGVGYIRDADHATITIPARPGRRVAGAIDWTLAAFINEAGLLALGIVIFTWWTGQPLAWICSGAGALTAATFALCYAIRRRLDDPIIVEVTPTALRICNLDDGPKTREFPRDRVYDVKFVSHSGKLVVRTQGREIFEFRPTDDEPELRRMATFLRLAIGLAVEEPPREATQEAT
jgi:hypothetical protein